MSTPTLLLALLACSEPAPVDLDRDGFSSPADCDDLDPTVNPDAPERWYDGVDSDCDGANDFDQDGDGYEVLVDCDDTEAEVHPGAEDPPYDLLDQDCDGEQEVDLDGDGWDWTLDCDDSDPAVHPAAEETWYDGVDANCDGADDFDQDGDKFELAKDCDDTNPGIFPGAEETWYDGIDTDCDGADDYDQDGDGASVDEDCDDLDPTRFPGQAELCDGLDQDCDEELDEDVIGPFDWYVDEDGDGYGEAYGGSVETCEELPEGSSIVDGDCMDDHSEVFPGAPEVCDNGLDDDCDGLAIGCTDVGWRSKSREVNAEGSGLALAHTGETLWYGHGSGLSSLDGEAISGPSGLGSSLLSLDIDGDGHEDLLAGSDEGAFLVFGPISAQSLSGHGEAVSQLALAGDQDDDGLLDFVLEGQLVLGGPSTTPSPDEGVLSLESSIVAPTDHDGDGLDELLVGNVEGLTPFGAAFVLPHGATGSSEDLSATWTLEADDELGSAVFSADIDGDGYEDLLIGKPDSSLGNAFIALGPVGGQDSHTDLIELRGSTTGDWGALLHAVDIDGDGAAEPILAGSGARSSSGEISGCVLVAWEFSTTTVSPQSMDSADAALSCGSVEGDGYGSALAISSSPGAAQVYVGAEGAGEVYLFSVEPAY